MNDSRLRIVTSLLDDARNLLVDIVDERPTDANPKDFNTIDAARQFINSSLVYVAMADDTQEAPHGAA